MKLILVFLLTCCISVVAPVSAQDFSIEKVREIPLDFGDEIVGSIADIARDAEGNYYLPDMQQHTIWVTDSQGSLIRRIGREGSGPGEMIGPRSVSISEDRIVVLDEGNNRIVIFSMKGGFLDSFRTELTRPTNLATHNDGRIAVGSLMGESLLTVYDADGNKISEGGSRTWPPDPQNLFMFANPIQHLSLTPDSEILYSPIKRYEVQAIGWDGNIRVTYTAKPPGYFPLFISNMQSATDELKRATTIFRPLAVDGYVVIQRSRNRGEPEKGMILHIDIFTRDGDLVQMDIEAPMYFIYAADDELYAIDNAPVVAGELNPHIVVYRLKGGNGP